jgi:ABC-type polar amino acid transport system ATPase subunit
MLQATKMTKKINGQQILAPCDITVERGEITTVIGPSGSGKSTLLRCLSFLDPPTSGQISINGDTYTFPLLKGEKSPTPWPEVSVVFQDLLLWPHMTLRENIVFPVRKTFDSQTEAYFEELIELFNMHEFVDRYSNEVSGGERQRAALVRALILRPKYLLLDEITSALDVEQVSIVLNCLQALKDKNIGILLVTHLLGFAHRAADHVIFIDNGTILESGGLELLNSPKNSRVRQFLSVIESAS